MKFLILYVGACIGFFIAILSISCGPELVKISGKGWLYDYQTFITGLIALGVGWLTVTAIRKQIQQAEETYQDQVNRMNFASALKGVQTELSHHARKIGQLASRGAVGDKFEGIKIIRANYTDKKNEERWKLFLHGYVYIFADRLLDAINNTPELISELEIIPDNLSEFKEQEKKNNATHNVYVYNLMEPKRKFYKSCNDYLRCYENSKINLRKIHPESFEAFENTSFKILYDKLKEIVEPP